MIQFAARGSSSPAAGTSPAASASPPAAGTSPAASASSPAAGTSPPASPPAAPASPPALLSQGSPSPWTPLGWLSDEIARLSAHIQAATYRLLVLIREFDEREGWHVEGFKSCARWLSWRTGIAPGAAREKVRVARTLRDLPHLSGALEKGELSYSAARALTRVATAETDEELVELARHTTAADLEKLVRAWRAADRVGDVEAERERHRERKLWVVPEADGSWVIRGRLDPEVGAVLCRALEAAEDALYAGGAVDPESPAGARRADALGLVAETALAGELRAPAAETSEDSSDDESDDERAGETAGRKPAPVVGRAERFQVVVHVSAETLSESTSEDGGGETADKAPIGASESRSEPPRIAGGPPVSAETSRRLACDAGVVVMTHHAQGKVLDVGRKRRTVPPAIRRALDRRDGGCRFPGCDSRFCEGHHLRHWAEGGATKLDNLALLCRRHHRLVHEDGWRMESTEGGDFRFYRPDGSSLPEVPEEMRLGDDPVRELERQQRALGIDEWTATPNWDGEPLDVDWALFTLWRPVSDSWEPEGAAGG